MRILQPVDYSLSKDDLSSDKTPTFEDNDSAESILFEAVPVIYHSFIQQSTFVPEIMSTTESHQFKSNSYNRHYF